MKNIGFVFQQFYLEENLTALENVCLPMTINKSIKSEDRIAKATSLLKELGLSDLDNFERLIQNKEEKENKLALMIKKEESLLYEMLKSYFLCKLPIILCIFNNETSFDISDSSNHFVFFNSCFKIILWILFE